MLASIPSFTSVQTWVWVALIALLARLISVRYKRGLSKFDGPFIASMTDLWRLNHAYRTRHRPPMIDLHRKYGRVVRVGPSTLSFAEPEAVKDIYRANKRYMKSDYYPVQAAVSKGQLAHTLFSSPDPTWHNNLRRSVASAFTPVAVLEYEHLVDSTIRVFVRELKARFTDATSDANVVELPTWLMYFAFDVMGELTYSSRHGFITSGSDVHGIIRYVIDFLTYGFLIGQMPVLDNLFRHNPVLLWLERQGWVSGTTFPGVIFALKHMKERSEKEEAGESLIAQQDGPMDLLGRFLQASKEHPNVVQQKEVLGLSLSMMIAGSETTSITLSAIFYYLLKNPACYSKLQEEVDSNFPLDVSSQDWKIPYSEARDLPYLNACVQEAFRMHPAFGFNYERIVPPPGDMIAGYYVPGATVVGCNSWVIQRDPEIFGPDGDTFSPERWLDNDEEKVKKMSRSLLQFGAGNHVCLGKNISLLEIYKLVPTFMRHFDITLTSSEKDWTLTNGANVRVSDFPVRIRNRAA